MSGKTIEAGFSRGCRPLALPVAEPVALPRSPCLPPPCDDDSALALAAVHAGRSWHALVSGTHVLPTGWHGMAPPARAAPLTACCAILNQRRPLPAIPGCGHGAQDV